MITRTIVSGYFNPIHLGHLQMIREAKQLGDYLIVIVNNDIQQKIKKGKIIMSEDERLEVVKELRSVDEVLLSVDTDKTVCESLKLLRLSYPHDQLVFCNGGDRPNMDAIPEADLGINLEFVFGVGGDNKLNSSTNINKLMGNE